jgi:acyl-CoA reductase-like NAD-dependent aldehyde dehydrogenase
MSISPIGHYINGQVAAGASGRSQSVTNPATGAVTGNVALANRSEVDEAVAAAQAAFPAWSDTPPLRRARVMFKFLELLNTHKDELWSSALETNPAPIVIELLVKDSSIPLDARFRVKGKDFCSH